MLSSELNRRAESEVFMIYDILLYKQSFFNILKITESRLNFFIECENYKKIIIQILDYKSKDERRMFLRNVGNYQQAHTALIPRRRIFFLS
jgi:hypothetical protein